MCTTLFRRSISVCVEHLFVNLWAMLEFMKCSLAKNQEKKWKPQNWWISITWTAEMKTNENFKNERKISLPSEWKRNYFRTACVGVDGFFLSFCFSLHLVDVFFRFVALLLFVSSPPSFDTTSTKQNDDRVVSKSSETKLRSAIERAFCEELNGWKSASSTWTEHLQMVSYRMSTSI